MKNPNYNNENRSIARFMGGIFSQHATLGVEIVTIGYEWYFSEPRPWGSRNLKYGESWDWLMPVISRCIDRNVWYSNKWSERLHDGLISLDMEECYISVAGFICDSDDF